MFHKRKKKQIFPERKKLPKCSFSTNYSSWQLSDLYHLKLSTLLGHQRGSFSSERQVSLSNRVLQSTLTTVTETESFTHDMYHHNSLSLKIQRFITEKNNCSQSFPLATFLKQTLPKGIFHYRRSYQRLWTISQT